MYCAAVTLSQPCFSAFTTCPRFPGLWLADTVAPDAAAPAITSPGHVAGDDVLLLLPQVALLAFAAVPSYLSIRLFLSY